MGIWYCYPYENGSMANPLFTSTSQEMAQKEANSAGYEVVQVIDFESEELETAPISKEDEGFTPGEWVVANSGGCVIVHNGKRYERVCLLKEKPLEITPEVEANAALIASAPTLYRDNVRLLEENKELKEVLAQFNHSVEHEGSIHGRIVDAVRNAKDLLNRLNK